MEPIIEIKNLGKKYNITHQKGSYVALRDVITNIFKNPFSFAKDKAKEITGIKTKEDFWALNDVNFEVKKGEIIGIIGKNGAGKSTLLKILSQITPPTTGEIKIKGRVGSLLEVGTGFHPELTGRENIFLNGAILGMTKKEIAGKFDQIVEFAGIDRFLDTPVKYYSSGMYVRLAFSVAAHMEPDILIIDEVLAVGDAEFQKKCLGKMEEVTKKDGRTILFVSHNMGAIQSLCSKCILLDKGKIIKKGLTSEVIDSYISGDIKTGEVILKETDSKVGISRIWLDNEKRELISSIEMGEDIFLNLNYFIKEKIDNVDITALISKEGNPLLYTFDTDTNYSLKHNRQAGQYTTRVKIPSSLFKEGSYSIQLSIGDRKNLVGPEACIKFDIINTKLNLNEKSSKMERAGFIYKNLDWEIIKL